MMNTPTATISRPRPGTSSSRIRILILKSMRTSTTRPSSITSTSISSGVLVRIAGVHPESESLVLMCVRVDGVRMMGVGMRVEVGSVKFMHLKRVGLARAIEGTEAPRGGTDTGRAKRFECTGMRVLISTMTLTLER